MINHIWNVADCRVAFEYVLTPNHPFNLCLYGGGEWRSPGRTGGGWACYIATSPVQLLSVPAFCCLCTVETPVRRSSYLAPEFCRSADQAEVLDCYSLIFLCYCRPPAAARLGLTFFSAACGSLGCLAPPCRGTARQTPILFSDTICTLIPLLLVDFLSCSPPGCWPNSLIDLFLVCLGNRCTYLPTY